jgi:hypothetical protein
MCCVAADRLFRMSATPQASASNTVDFKTVSKIRANESENECIGLSPFLLRFFD